MDDTVQALISLLVDYWKTSGVMDARTKSYCRQLAESILGKFPEAARERVVLQPEEYSADLAKKIDQLSSTDPNTAELIRVLLATAKRGPSKAQSIQVSGDGNQVITVGGNLTGSAIFPNNPALSPQDVRTPGGSRSPRPGHRRQAADEYEQAVFVSYAWGGQSERMVDELEQAFATRGIRIVRDKKDLSYKGSIELFEQRIGRGQCIILIISDKYLRSAHCMYELVEVERNRGLRERIFPIVLSDASIFKALDRLEYIKYWDEQIETLNQSIKKVDLMANLAGVMADLDTYVRIRSSFDRLTDLLSDMNVLTPEIHAASGFSTLVRAVESVIAGGEGNEGQ